MRRITVYSNENFKEELLITIKWSGNKSVSLIAPVCDLKLEREKERSERESWMISLGMGFS